MDQYRAELERLTQELAEANREKIRAAECGLVVLEENQALKQKYVELESEQETLRKETRLLLGLCLDSRARYRASTLHLNQAGQDYQRALDICRQEQGDTHPQVGQQRHTPTGRTAETHTHR